MLFRSAEQQVVEWQIMDRLRFRARPVVADGAVPNLYPNLGRGAGCPGLRCRQSLLHAFGSPGCGVGRCRCSPQLILLVTIVASLERPRRLPCDAPRKGGTARLSFGAGASPARRCRSRLGWSLRHLAILPPPLRVMATTDGRGGISSAKSGHRVNGLSNVDNPDVVSSGVSPGCCTATKKVSMSGVR